MTNPDFYDDYGIYTFNMLLEMIKNRELDEYDETLNYKDKAVCEAERQRQRDFYATYPKFVIFAKLYVPVHWKNGGSASHSIRSGSWMP
jgi:hypothetical protein